MKKNIRNWITGATCGIPKSKPSSGNSKGNNERKKSAREFLQALPTMPSHYCRSSSNKNYLEPLFASKSEVYREYKTKCTENGKAPYHKTGFTELFHELNLSFHLPHNSQMGPNREMMQPPLPESPQNEASASLDLALKQRDNEIISKFFCC